MLTMRLLALLAWFLATTDAAILPSTILPSTLAARQPLRRRAALRPLQRSYCVAMAFPTDMDSVVDGALDGGIEGLKIYTRLIDARIILSWFPQIARNEMLAPLVELTRAVCSDAPSDWVLASVEVSVPLVMAAAAGMTVHEVSAMERALCMNTVWCRRSALRPLSRLRGSRPVLCARTTRHITVRDERIQRVRSRWQSHGGDYTLRYSTRQAPAWIGFRRRRRC